MAEILTLIQTGKSRKIPIILVESKFWKGLLDWFENTLVTEGTIDADDLQLIQVIDEPQQVVNAIFEYYRSRTFEPSAEEKERMLHL